MPKNEVTVRIAVWCDTILHLFQFFCCSENRHIFVSISRLFVIIQNSAHTVSPLRIRIDTVDECLCCTAVSYKNNVNVGTATVTVKGKGDYTGSAEKTFKIKARSFSDSAVKVTNTKTVVGKTASPIVKYNGNTLKIDNDYTVSMKNNKKTGISSATRV